MGQYTYGILGQSCRGWDPRGRVGVGLGKETNTDFRDERRRFVLGTSLGLTHVRGLCELGFVWLLHKSLSQSLSLSLSQSLF